MRKVLYTLNVDGYAPEITTLTYPYMRHYAHKIGAEFVVISERRFPDYPPAYEKLQIHDLARENGADWHLYLDSDALVHPETPDWTVYLPRDTVAHNGSDFANVRWRYDNYLLRDGRNIGCCNWNTIASSWCLDLWKPLDDMTLEEALDNIYPTVEEANCPAALDSAHLLDDYVLSRNVARFGLKFQSLVNIERQLGFDKAGFYWHAYTLTTEQKVEEMKKVLEGWKVPSGFLKA